MKNDFFQKTYAATFIGISILLAFFSNAAAQEEVVQTWYGQPVSVPASQIINGDYFAYGPLVEVSGTVNGDVYAVGGQILIDGQVNGDVLIAGGQVTISGSVSQDARVAGGQVSFSGTIGRNLTVAAGNVELAPSAVVRGGLVGAGGSIHVAAPLGRGIKVAAGSLILSNRVPGNVYAAVQSLRLTSRADVQGDINYYSHREASVDSGAKLKGKLTRSIPPDLPRLGREKVLAAMAGWGLFMIAVSF
ncbi:MAG: hypothetical protein GTO40_13140, partial [Deltaproteobacteria bacterium]|nr:hypothetical protein [Deltaproteobacteria bacterium]